MNRPIDEEASSINTSRAQSSEQQRERQSIAVRPFASMSRRERPHYLDPTQEIVFGLTFWRTTTACEELFGEILPPTRPSIGDAPS